MQKSIGGVTEMGGLPDALFIIDVKREAIAVSEASKMGIPIIGIVDSNSNPEGIDYVIPGNDDSIRSIALFTEAVADACLKGSEAATGLKQEEPQSGPAIVRKVEPSQAEESSKADDDIKEDIVEDQVEVDEEVAAILEDENPDEKKDDSKE